VEALVGDGAAEVTPDELEIVRRKGHLTSRLPLADAALACVGIAHLAGNPLHRRLGDRVGVAKLDRSHVEFATPGGAATLQRLLDEADVVVCSYRPVALDRCGLSPQVRADRHRASSPAPPARGPQTKSRRPPSTASRDPSPRSCRRDSPGV
jgi:hypothetical protein